jgi:hypothetical protein
MTGEPAGAGEMAGLLLEGAEEITEGAEEMTGRPAAVPLAGPRVFQLLE